MSILFVGTSIYYH